MSLKPFLFIPLFIIFLALSILKTSQILNSTDFILSFSLEKYLELVYLTIFIFLASFFYILASTLNKDYLIIFIVSAVGAFLPFMFFGVSNALVLAMGIFLFFNLVYLQIQTKLKNYLTFDPNLLLSSSVKNLAVLLILLVSSVYYLNINQTIKKSGFSLPGPLIDAAINMSGQNTQESPEIAATSNIQITPELLQQARQNPAVLKQFGLTLNDLENLQSNQGKTSGENKDGGLVKNLVKAQIDKAIEPYLDWIPAILALLLMITLYSFLNILTLFLPLLMFLIFKALEATGYIKFEKEMREAKKLVV